MQKARAASRSLYSLGIWPLARRMRKAGSNSDHDALDEPGQHKPDTAPVPDTLPDVAQRRAQPEACQRDESLLVPNLQADGACWEGIKVAREGNAQLCQVACLESGPACLSNGVNRVQRREGLSAPPFA